MSAHLRVPKTIKLFIGGDFPRTESGRSYPALVNGSERVYAQLSLASRKDLRNAVTAAQAALEGWASRTAYNRAQILYRMAEMCEGKRAEIAEILTTVLGRQDADQEVNRAIDAFVYYAGFADKYQQVLSTVNPVSGPHHCFTQAEPVGVVGLLNEEGFSFSALVSRLAAILASGNTVVALMPGAGGALIAALAEVLATSDLPKGVVNLLSGSNKELAEHFGTHMEIQALADARGDAAGLAEMKKQAAENLKRVHVPGSQNGLEEIARFVEFKTVWHPAGH